MPKSRLKNNLSETMKTAAGQSRCDLGTHLYNNFTLFFKSYTLVAQQL
jgi:hypothetical protein